LAKRKLLREIAARVYGEKYADKFWKRIEIIGDIAVIRRPFGVTVEELQPLAEELLRRLPYVRSVWTTWSPVEGDYRLREFVYLAGEERSETLYREHGCVFRVDIRRVYISPRLSYEHMRVARLIRPGEVVINMYAGAGLFSVIAACHAKPWIVYSIDINPYAYRYMVENVLLNKVSRQVVPLLGDAARLVPERLRGIADRILMPLPEYALEHLPAALEGLRRRRGILHIYLHIDTPRGVDPRRAAAETVEARLRGLGYRAHVSFTRVVRTVGPRKSQVVVDVEVAPENA